MVTDLIYVAKYAIGSQGRKTKGQMTVLNVVAQRKAGLYLLLTAITVLALSGCATRTFYDAPPPMPIPVEPAVDSVLANGVPVRFVWQASRDTDYYEFHIFNRLTSDISQFYRSNLLPASVCGGGLCALTMTFSMPLSDSHAWRVRAVNNAGFTDWSRSIFENTE